jgi:heme/copper-type cytochrome/quinol oxidase subunit 4
MMLCCDPRRRAKRLRKLDRMMQSSTAQKATGAWKYRTIALLLVVLATHIACFVVLTTQVERR